MSFDSHFLTLLNANDKRGEKQIRETALFTTVTNNIKFLGIILIKQVKERLV